MIKILFIAVLVGVGGWIHLAQAQHVIVLKNGRQITVQSYRDEGSMIRFSGLGGEIAISKDQVQSIRRASAGDGAGPASLAVDRVPAASTPQGAPAPTKTADVKPSGPTVSADEQIAQKRAEEEKAYQQKIKELTDQLRELRDRYAATTRGTQGSDPSFFTTEEAFRGHQEDLLSRLRDAQNRAQGLETGNAAKSPPFSLDPPPAYSAKQKELSDLRSRMIQLEGEREKLIDEMKAKNFDAGSVYLD